MRILVVAPSWIGDLVMSQTLLIKLKELHPNCIIDVLAPKWCIGVLNRMEEVNQSILMPITHGEFNLKGRFKLGKELRANNYDEAYILPNSWKSALIPFFAKINTRIGWIGESRYFILTNYRKNKKDFSRLIERYVSLALPKNEILSAKDLPEIKNPKLQYNSEISTELSSKLNISKNVKIIGICPGAEYGATKKWPTEYYAQIIENYLKQNPNSESWIFGSNKDEITANEVKEKISKEYQNKIKILTGKTTIEEAIDLLAHCELVICNDSGLMHITAAVGTRLVAIFGSTSTKYTPPSTKNALLIESDEPCHPCFKKTCKYNSFACLKKLTPDIVWNKIQNWNKSNNA